MKPILINNIELAHNEEKRSGELRLNDCSRLAKVIDTTNQDQLKIQYNLTGHASKFHLPSMRLIIKSTLPLTCQRCLEVMQFDIALTFDYVISESEPEAFDESDDVDWVEVSRGMNLNELIEDELLIAIPLAPTHQHACRPLTAESGEKHNPFAALKDLIK